ncbi:MAG: hypothetical protein IT292_00865 [Deltaproteobacteria bacterium]|nr:hypothetical protein [Deltaproteobacteria bacterium]
MENWEIYLSRSGSTVTTRGLTIYSSAPSIRNLYISMEDSSGSANAYGIYVTGDGWPEIYNSQEVIEEFDSSHGIAFVDDGVDAADDITPRVKNLDIHIENSSVSAQGITYQDLTGNAGMYIEGLTMSLTGVNSPIGVRVVRNTATTTLKNYDVYVDGSASSTTVYGLITTSSAIDVNNLKVLLRMPPALFARSTSIVAAHLLPIAASKARLAMPQRKFTLIHLPD